jgi:ADP-ribose pyrophosphatase YjhB (NUDIX family)
MEKPNIRVVVIIIRENKLLLLKLKDGDDKSWILPGGSIKYGESIVENAQREILEETNLEVRLNRILMINESISPDRHRHTINIYFLGEILGGVLSLGRREILKECRFMEWEEIENIELSPNIKKEIKEMMKEGLYIEARHKGVI